MGYACLSETQVNAVVRDGAHRVGEIDLPFIDVVRTRFERFGLRHTALRMFEEPCSHLLDRRGAA